MAEYGDREEPDGGHKQGCATEEGGDTAGGGCATQTGPMRLGPYRRREAGTSKPAPGEAAGRPEAGAPLCGARQVANLPHPGAAEDGRALRLRSLRSAQDRQGRLLEGRGGNVGAVREPPLQQTGPMRLGPYRGARAPPPYSSPVKGEVRIAGDDKHRPYPAPGGADAGQASFAKASEPRECPAHR